eukprot:6193059-Pleurochrysis_carterae.AAC.2
MHVGSADDCQKARRTNAHRPRPRPRTHLLAPFSWDFPPLTFPLRCPHPTSSPREQALWQPRCPPDRNV